MLTTLERMPRPAKKCLILTLVGGAVALGGCADRSNPAAHEEITGHQRNGVVPQSDTDGRPVICVTDADEADHQRLTDNERWDDLPSWSPDSRTIAYVSGLWDDAEIYVVKADGTEPTRLTQDNDMDGYPSWSPDGTRIAFGRFPYRGETAERFGPGDIWVMNSDGTDQRNLTNTSHHDGMPAWSPDGTKIAFVSQSLALGEMKIHVMNADGTERRRLTDSVQDALPAWSPDGGRIVFESWRDGNFEIYVMAADGSEQTRLTDDPGQDRYPSWRPDGTKIAFMSTRRGSHDLFAMNPDGSNSVQLTHSHAHHEDAKRSADVMGEVTCTSGTEPAWSPDGRKMAFVSDRDGDMDIYVMDVDESLLLDSPSVN